MLTSRTLAGNNLNSQISVIVASFMITMEQILTQTMCHVPQVENLVHNELIHDEEWQSSEYISVASNHLSEL
jgi:hypothetical protein